MPILLPASSPEAASSPPEEGGEEGASGGDAGSESGERIDYEAGPRHVEALARQ